MKKLAAVIVPLFFVMAIVTASYECNGMPSMTFWWSLKITLALGTISIILLWKLKRYSE